MTREVLVTGATGTLGPKLVGAATAAGHHVRAMSRRSHVGYTGVHWSQGDLLANTGIDAAVDGVDVVVHGATQGTGDKDVTSTQNLATAARRAGVGHIIYVSIVGIDRIPLPYYQTQAARRARPGSLRCRPHGVARHPVSRPDQQDLLDPAVLTRAVDVARSAVPAHRHP